MYLYSVTIVPWYQTLYVLLFFSFSFFFSFLIDGFRDGALLEMGEFIYHAVQKHVTGASVDPVLFIAQ